METPRERLLEQRGEMGYSWLYQVSVVNGGLRITVTVVSIALSAIFFAWYSRTSPDASPDSTVGLVYATIGTVLLFMAAVMFSLRRHNHRGRKVGGLRESLGWHICFGLIGLAFLGMHSFGEFNPRSGTYALYAMIALVISGLVGRVLDRVIPRLITAEAHQALTAQGDDRIETISQRLQAMVVHNTQSIRGFAAPRTQAPARSGTAPQRNNGATAREQDMRMSWDLAYISLESTPQEVSRESGSFRLVPDRKSTLLQPGALMPGTQEPMSELEEVRRAMQHEIFYRYITRYWRKFHVLLAVTTVALLVWHLVYAFQLLIPVIFH